jgi:hypothetical protein
VVRSGVNLETVFDRLHRVISALIMSLKDSKHLKFNRVDA